MENSKNNTLLLLICTAAFATPFLTSGLNIAIPQIGTEFGINATQLPWITTSMLLGMAIFMVPSGKAGDLYGYRKVLLFGTAALMFACLGIFKSYSYVWILFFRFVQGCAGGIISSTIMALLTSRFPPKERGRAMGIFSAAVYLGLSMGPFLGGMLTSLFGWKSIFLFVAILCLGVGALTVTQLPKDPPTTTRPSFDWWGTLLYSVTLVVLLLGTGQLKSLWGLLCTVSGIFLALFFVRHQQKQTQPVFDVGLFSMSRVFSFSCLAALINYGSVYAVTYLLSHYLQISKQLSPNQAGMFLVVQPIIQAILSPVTGKASDRFEPRVLSSLGMGMGAAGLFAFSVLSPTTSSFFILLASAVLGSGFALFAAPNTNAIMSAVPKNRYGAASGIVGAMRLLGQIGSMVIVMLLAMWQLGDASLNQVPQDLFIRYIRSSFLFLALLNVAGIFFSCNRGNVR